MIKAVVFDLDGTLLDTIPDIAGALNRALAACGWPTHSIEACKTFVGNGIFNAIRRALPEGTTEADVLQVNAVYQREYPAHCTEATRPYNGIGELFSQLAQRGILLGVLTNKEQPRRSVEPVDFPFAGGSGAGVSVQPVGFLVVQDGSVRMLPASCSTVADRMVDLIPTVIDDVKNLISKPSSQGMM